MFGQDLNPDLLAFVADGEVVGCCLLVWRTQWVRGIPLRRVYLNCAGENEAESTCLEFNSLLSLPQYERRVAEALATFLRGRKWDEVLLQGAVEQDAIRILADSLGANEVTEAPAYYIEFSEFRSPPGALIARLSADTRRNIKRTQRSYEEIGGPCTLQVAHSAEEALEMLRQLAGLHQARWISRGKPGAFHSPRFTDFHEALIRQSFDRVAMVRVQAGNTVVGLLYGLLFRGVIYFYQSGFAYIVDHRSPGLLTLYLTISHYLERPEIRGLDFMAGNMLYKRSLARTQRPLRWIVVRRRTARSLLFLGLRSLKRAGARVFNRTRQGNQLVA
jgi:hypothetical protein